MSALKMKIIIRFRPLNAHAASAQLGPASWFKLNKIKNRKYGSSNIRTDRYT